jgi:hypothetical protein
MRGLEKALSNTGCPWPGGVEVEFQQADVAALGKLVCWGSACIQFIVRLTDGREVFVRADRQAKEDERFLRKIAKRVPKVGYATRGEGWRTSWIDIDRERYHSQHVIAVPGCVFCDARIR